MPGLTEQIGGFIERFDLAAAPGAGADAAGRGFADCVAVMIAGAGEEAPRIASAMVEECRREEDGTPEIPSGRRLSAPDAAFVNGVAGHVLDYDDVAMDGHVSVALVPAILAEGWALGRSGHDALGAYIVGYEIWALLNALEPGALHERGFHPTAAWGTLAAAGACARLHRLDAEAATRAIAISASLAAGLVANFGTMTKSLHAGRAGQAGVLAARLAKQGFTASPDVLEHATGFMHAHSPSGRPDVEERDHELGRRWRLPDMGLHIKRYPICYATHRSIDAMLELADEHDLKPSDIWSITVKAGRTQLLMLRNHAPTTGLEAKFSMEFAMASAVVARRVGLRELADGFVRRLEVVELMRKVTCVPVEAVGQEGLPFGPADVVVVTLNSGRVLEHAPVPDARGSWRKPMTSTEFREKFDDCVGASCSQETAAALFGQLSDLSAVRNLRELALPQVRASGLPR
jgi:2-methylcitrate dehydratase PrpD